MIHPASPAPIEARDYDHEAASGDMLTTLQVVDWPCRTFLLELDGPAQYPQLHKVLKVLSGRELAFNLMMKSAFDPEIHEQGGGVHVYIWPRQNQSKAGKFQMGTMELLGYGIW